eukprot:TRINITY_DN18325_c0_g1_i1.p1 TRINITY_DN18325_c0_g1~~TRINITY_DN18325_c0_g1_i1.p1  ORF type:complete len:286 (+),score=28.40 TRINITY_DN18325_c0_g1_i1:561-1418(+)
MKMFKDFFLFLAISCFVVAIGASFILKIEKTEEIKESIGDEEDTDTFELLKESEPLVALEEIEEIDFYGLSLLKQPDFWIIFVSFVFLAGSGLMLINHMGEIVISQERDSNEKNVAVGLFSVCNFVGRLFIGFLSDKYVHVMNRAYFYAITGAILGCAHLLFFAWTSVPAMWIVILGTGFLYGGLFALIPIMASLYFGMKHFGQNYGVLALAPGVGQFALGYLAGYFYDVNVDDADSSSSSNSRCYGDDCYSFTFAITGGLCVLGSLLGFLIGFRRRNFKENTSS